MKFWKNIKHVEKNFPKIKISILLWAAITFSFLTNCGIIYIEGLFFAFLHELCHIITARFFDLGTREIYITPIGLKAYISNFYSVCCAKRCFILAVGPLFNLIAAVLFFSFGRTSETYINTALFLCNILPVSPLDGGRLIKEVLGEVLGVLRSRKICSLITNTFGFGIIILGILVMIFYCLNISIVCLGIYILKENKRNYISDTHDFFAALKVKRKQESIIHIREIAVNENTDLISVMRVISFDSLLIVNMLKNGKLNERLTQWEIIDKLQAIQKNEIESPIL